ncbi:putative membrane protein [Mycetocola sp. CAN_C7]
MGDSPFSERLADAQELVYGPILDWARRSVFQTNYLGHSVHPLLTDLTLGCWVSASLLDLAGGSQARRGATLLVGVGLAAAVPTAIAGASDWAELKGDERRIGAVHGLGADAAIFLFLGSLISRKLGHYTLGTGLSLAGNAIVAGAGFLGGHLALNRGTARRTTALAESEQTQLPRPTS